MTVFVAWLGQVLSRRSVLKTARGVTIAEMSMRTWVIQPGFMITNWQNLRFTARTLLGVITLIGAVVAMLYTTASDALVAPHLRFGNYADMKMVGLVNTGYGNSTYVKATCQNPVPLAMDPFNDTNAFTCLETEHAGQGMYWSYP